MSRTQQPNGRGGYAAVAIVALLIGRCSASGDAPIEQATTAAPDAQAFTAANAGYEAASSLDEVQSAAEPVASLEAAGAESSGSEGSYGGTAEPEENGPAEVYYPNCRSARAAGAAPIHVGEAGYALIWIVTTMVSRASDRTRRLG